MNRMIRLLMAIVCLIAASLARAEEGKFSASYLVNANGWTLQPVVSYKIAALEGILGTKYDLDIRSVAGYNTDTQESNLGVAFVYPFAIAKNASVDLGYRVMIQGDRFAGAIFLGWTLYTR